MTLKRIHIHANAPVRQPTVERVPAPALAKWGLKRDTLGLIRDVETGELVLRRSDSVTMDIHGNLIIIPEEYMPPKDTGGCVTCVASVIIIALVIVIAIIELSL
jgi:hypothetical protein